MNTFKVYFTNGDSLVTGFNGSLEDAIKYYVGQWFNSEDETGIIIGARVEQIS